VVYLHSLLDLVLTYMYVVEKVYLSNHVNHLFIMNQKITSMAIIFKINMWAYTVIVTPLFLFSLYLIEKLCFALSPRLRLLLYNLEVSAANQIHVV